MADVLLKFTKILKNGITVYNFEGFENVDSRGELPCEYLSGSHFAAWNGIFLYSDGEKLYSLAPGNEISESAYSDLISTVATGKKRLKEIRRKHCI